MTATTATVATKIAAARRHVAVRLARGVDLLRDVEALAAEEGGDLAENAGHSHVDVITALYSADRKSVV